MVHTEVTTTSWSSRLGGAFKGILFGLLLFIAGTVLLYWNEGRTVKTGDAISEARAVTVPVEDISQVDPALMGKVIHASGLADTTDTLVDPVFGVTTTAIKLSRKVEYYQWVEKAQSETRKKMGGGEETVTTYSYTQEWVPQPIPSENFKDDAYRNANFVRGDFNDEEMYAPKVTFGAYVLPQSMKTSIGGAVPLDVQISDEQRNALEKSLGQSTSEVSELSRQLGPAANEFARQTESAARQGRPRVNTAYLGNKKSALPSRLGAARQYVHTQNNVIYLGATPGAPEVGDVRVSFRQVLPAEISIVAKVKGDTFEPFIASNGYSFSRLTMGRISAENMFAGAESSNKATAWILRVVGALVVISGLGMIFRPLSVLADVLPFLGTLVGMGTGFVAGLLGVAWSCVVIAVAWVRFRPMLALALIGVAVALVVTLFVLKRKKPVEV